MLQTHTAYGVAVSQQFAAGGPTQDVFRMFKVCSRVKRLVQRGHVDTADKLLARRVEVLREAELLKELTA